MNEVNAFPARSRWLLPLVCALSCLGLGILSGLGMGGGGSEWYQSLVKPPGQPPAWLFGPVWTVFYLMMGVALGRLILRRAWQAVGFFIAQFILNVAWTPVFFGAHQMVSALAVIASLWIMLAGTIWQAAKADRISAWLLAPYLVWVSYAAYLNAGIVWLNQ